MENNIVLSIAIPTYNRKSELKETLDSVLKQAQECVEVLVCDNASTDGTQYMMKEYEGRVTYYRNKENIGPDANFLKCLERAKGKYVHWLSDDDLLMPGAVKHILDLIRKEQPEYIHLNTVDFEQKDAVCVDCPRIVLKDDLITCEKAKYMDYIGAYITFLSGIIIKKESFMKIANAESYIGTNFIHAHIVLDILKGEGKKVIVTAAPCVAVRVNNGGGYDIFRVWVREYKRLLLDSGVKNGFDKAKMKALFLHDMKTLLAGLVFSARMQKTGFRLHGRMMLLQETWYYPSMWLRVYPIVFLPKGLLRWVAERRKWV